MRTISFLCMMFCSPLLAGCSNTEPTTIDMKEMQMDKLAVTYVSSHSFDETIARLKEAMISRQLNIFTEVDHGKGAMKAGLELGKAHLILFGNPKVGTLLMQKNPEMGLELPMKALVYEQDGQVKIRMTDIEGLAVIYGLDATIPPVSKVAGVLNAIASEAAQ